MGCSANANQRKKEEYHLKSTASQIIRSWGSCRALGRWQNALGNMLFFPELSCWVGLTHHNSVHGNPMLHHLIGIFSPMIHRSYIPIRCRISAKKYDQQPTTVSPMVRNTLGYGREIISEPKTLCLARQRGWVESEGQTMALPVSYSRTCRGKWWNNCDGLKELNNFEMV